MDEQGPQVRMPGHAYEVNVNRGGAPPLLAVPIAVRPNRRFEPVLELALGQHAQVKQRDQYRFAGGRIGQFDRPARRIAERADRLRPDDEFRRRAALEFKIALALFNHAKLRRKRRPPGHARGNRRVKKAPAGRRLPFERKLPGF